MRKIQAMYKHYGRRWGKWCKDCLHYLRYWYHDKPYRKCRAYGQSHSEATDWTGKWEACGLFDKTLPAGLIPMVDVLRGRKRTAPEEPLEGQLSLEEV